MRIFHRLEEQLKWQTDDAEEEIQVRRVAQHRQRSCTSSSFEFPASAKIQNQKGAQTSRQRAVVEEDECGNEQDASVDVKRHALVVDLEESNSFS